MTEEKNLFWHIGEDFLQEQDITKGTLMGFPCLRVNGNFFATADHRTGDLIVKLSKDRVQSLINKGVGSPFKPAGRVFKEWVLIKHRDDVLWKRLISEAKEFVDRNS